MPCLSNCSYCLAFIADFLLEDPERRLRAVFGRPQTALSLGFSVLLEDIRANRRRQTTLVVFRRRFARLAKDPARSTSSMLSTFPSESG